ncbi:Lrp/AsnC family transcriptional regulator [Actinoplanes sp. L3-i22]|uniref:Lrp/AsnC family transcriptional regulator n=1 Tax=Actinoplanes sp. L3-i22 TaxID=2836373 RepID=UPI001C842493|nr:Lrp/AsnC family transcriptional regulator [Actinoplanes sp. L3-i22]
MTSMVADSVLDDTDRRLVAALQCDGRVSVERVATVLGLSARVVHRRLGRLLGDGTVRVVAAPRVRPYEAVMLLRIRVLRGSVSAITDALAARADVPYLDVSAAGDEISAVLAAGRDPRNRLVFRQLPATKAVTSVEAQTALHVYADASAWRLDVLTAAERAGLATAVPTNGVDDLDLSILDALAADARLPAAAVAARLGRPESTIRRRLAALPLRTQTYVDPLRLGLHVDANLWLRLPPADLDRVGLALAVHPAVHGVLSTTGRANLHVAVWLSDLEALHRFITTDLAALGVPDVETVLVGRAVKRPGLG